MLGLGTALIDLAYFLLVGAALGPLLLWPRTRPRARRVLTAGARVLAELERRRRRRFFRDRYPAGWDERKALHYLAGRMYAGVLTGIVAGLLGFGALLAVLVVLAVARGDIGWAELLGQALLGGALLFLDLQGLVSLATLERRLAQECFGPSERELLERRISELAASRAAVIRAVDAERRRIERDLHDGLQQRLVALAMLLGRARRHHTPERTLALLTQAHAEAQEVIGELREVAWRAYPTALDSLGLEEALAGAADRCALPVSLDYRLTGRLPEPVETAAYFVVSECVTNAAKHSGARGIRVRVERVGGAVLVGVTDDGVGGADPAGGGLAGLRDRVAGLEGRLTVSSPPGGPTTITAELPCA
nr:histidine kinase [Streptomyces hoynatensis]